MAMLKDLNHAITLTDAIKLDMMQALADSLGAGCVRYLPYQEFCAIAHYDENTSGLEALEKAIELHGNNGYGAFEFVMIGDRVDVIKHNESFARLLVNVMSSEAVRMATQQNDDEFREFSQLTLDIQEANLSAIRVAEALRKMEKESQ